MNFCERFVNKTSKLFRLAVFTASGPVYADKIIEHIDQYNLVYQRLYRKDMSKKGDKLIKDLTRFSNDMSRVIIVDSKVDGVYPIDNHFVIQSYNKFDPNDDELKKLAGFFRNRVSDQQHNVDLRDIIKGATI